MSPSPTYSSRGEGGRPARRFFLGVGVSDAGGMFRKLAAVTADLEGTSRLFFSLGYTLVPLPRNPNLPDLRQSITAWLERVDLGPADTVVVYYSGHGYVVNKHHYLCARGFDKDRPVTTGFKTRDLVELFLSSRSRPGKFWLILDCCQAGSAFDDDCYRGISAGETDAFMLAASGSWGQAVDGTFAERFCDAARRAPRPGTRGLSLDELAGAVNERRLGGQRAVQLGVSSGRFDLLDPPGPVDHRRGGRDIREIARGGNRRQSTPVRRVVSDFRSGRRQEGAASRRRPVAVLFR